MNTISFNASDCIMHLKMQDNVKDNAHKSIMRNTQKRTGRAPTSSRPDTKRIKLEIEQNKFRPLSEVRSDKNLTRVAKRAIHFLKYRALGILKGKKLYFTVKYAPSRSEPIPFTVIPETKDTKNGITITVKAPEYDPPQVPPLQELHREQEQEDAMIEEVIELVYDDYVTDDNLYTTHVAELPNYEEISPNQDPNGYTVPTAASWVKESWKRLKKQLLPGQCIMMTTPMGGMKEAESVYDLDNFVEAYGRDPHIYIYQPLNGGGREKKKRRGRKRKGRRRGSPMIQAGQLGYRNPPQMKAHYPVVKEFWRYNQILETDGSGNISAYLSLRNPLAAVNGSGTYVRAQDLAEVYDEYKVIKTAVVIDFLYLNPIVGDVAIASDYDSIPSGIYTYGSLLDTQYVRTFNGTNQISYSTKVPKLSEGTYRERPAIIHQGGFYDFNTPPDEGFIAIAFERYTPNVRLCRISTMMQVLCRRRRTLNATLPAPIVTRK